MRRLLAIATTLFAAAALGVASGCSPKSEFRNFASPENAVKTLLEASLIQDEDTAVEALVERERLTAASNDGPVFEFDENSSYSLGATEHYGNGRASVVVTFKALKSDPNLPDISLPWPFHCELEPNAGWRVTMLGTLQAMQQAVMQQMDAAAPR